LAFDLGAETGRAFLGRVVSGSLRLQEIHRFPNEPLEDRSGPRWDVARLWLEIRKALNAVEETEDGSEGPVSVGVDAWGVDYALLGENGALLENPRHYRDRRNLSAMDEVLTLVSREEIYRTTGIQFMPINTINQLLAESRAVPSVLASARRLVMIPDLFHHWLTNKENDEAVCELTCASTTQFLDARTRTWARELLSQLALPAELPAPLVEPGSVLGKLRDGIVRSRKEILVIAPASHDTASAVAAVTARENTAFLSSGTWSLVGMELDEPILTQDALRLNFTNEAGVCGTTRFLKNVMGLWMLQGCRRAWATLGREWSYASLTEAAKSATPFQHLVDPDDSSFLNPDDMPAAIDCYCAKRDQLAPDGPAAYTRAILESLALKYRLVIRDLEKLASRRIEQIRVIGGGSKNRLLNQFTADATGRRVLAGPTEAAALGNIGVQMVAMGPAASLAEAREIIDRSFQAKVFEPRDTAGWDRVAERFEQYCDFTYA
jgi:rhamnulokinase